MSTTIETLCNLALDAVGYTRHIGHIGEGSTAANIALNAWGQARDSLLFVMEPRWARKDVPLALLKSAPNITGAFANYDITPWSDVYPPLPWLYEYSLPSDLIKPLSVKTTPLIIPQFMPRYKPINFSVSNTAETLYANITGPVLTYIWRAANPDLWHQDFQNKMIEALVQQFQRELAKGPPQKVQNADAAN